jgi:myo-inositol 2-dehydrogenase/D-chiro-inositol 1-dehydrogenase
VTKAPRHGDRLHIGLIGVGRIGAMHARTLGGLEDVGRLTIADANFARARGVADELGARAVETPEALLSSGVDAVVIATATAGHAPLLRLAARAGLPVFCEKPVALDLPTLDHARDNVTRARILVQVGFQRRFDAGYRAAHEAVASGAAGTILAVRAATHDPAPPARQYIAVSGGVFRDLAIHDFDAIRFVTGQEVVEVYADGGTVETKWFEEYGDFDTAVAVLRLSGGAFGILSSTRHDPLGYDVRLEVFGTEDSIGVGLDGRTPLRSVEPGVPHAETPGYRNFVERFESAYRAELAAFVAAILEGRPSSCTLQDARAALVVALAAERSCAERRPVRIEDVEVARTPATG